MLVPTVYDQIIFTVIDNLLCQTVCWVVMVEIIITFNVVAVHYIMYQDSR